MTTVTARRWLLAASISLSVFAWSGAARATDYALLIGVNDYPQLPRRLWLRGPVNDVELIRGVLLERGFQPSHIDVLKSGKSPAREPTRQNILFAFAKLKDAVRPGDHVFFYLAGHGSQQPQRPGKDELEPDGLDEVFLPSNVGQWDGSGIDTAIPNALLDDEIADWMDALVDAGSAVWGVFDMCHAAGMVRGEVPAGTRAIHAADLNLPAARLTQRSHRHTHKAPKQTMAGKRTDGRSLAFASRTHELAGEEWLPRGASMAVARRHGVFTFHLVNALRRTMHIDAATLEKAVQAEYILEQRLAPVPTWVGDAKVLWP